MHYEKNERDIYRDTIDNSKEISLQKAITIFVADQNDNKPRITRPDINPWRGIVKIIIAVVSICITCTILYFCDISLIYGIVICFFITVFSTKRTILWLILIYQKYAPEQIRASCVFTPTCSDYMVLAITKYGLFKGMAKGIKRLLSCHPPNGGIDNP